MPRWLLYCFLTILCFGMWAVTFKPLQAQEVSAGQSQALCTVGILPIMLVLAASPSWRMGGSRVRGSIWSFVAGVLVGVGNFTYFLAQDAGAKATTAVSLSMLYPAATVILALLFLKERLHVVQALGIAASLAAIYLLNVSEPGEMFSAWMLYALAPIALWGVAGLIQKVATADVAAEVATFWFLTAFIPLGLVLYIRERFDWNLSATGWVLVSLQGATYGLGNLSLLAAFRNGGQASIVAPLSGLYPVVAIPLAILLFQEIVGPREWAGIALAVAAGVALSLEPKQTPADTKAMAQTTQPTEQRPP
jgi:uncharacterized membrane protein